MHRLNHQFRILALVLGLMLPLTALAANGEPKPPKQIAQDTVETLLQAMDGRRDELRANPQQLYALVNRVLVPLVDLNYMSQLVLGRYWRTATPEQRERFKKAFKTMLIRTYGNALLGFTKDRIEFQPVRAPKDADKITFRAMVITDSGDKVPVSLEMHLVDNQWKVYDGRVGSLSFVTNYRSQFSSYIRRNDLEDLISKMEKRYGIKH